MRDSLQAMLRRNLPDEASPTLAVVGVQPGIRRSLIDAHLADLMAFGIGYARQGGAAKAYWLISE
jgi:hypothetical protein